MKIISRKLQEMSNPENQRRFYPIPTDAVIKAVLERYKTTDICEREEKTIALFQRNPLNDNGTDVDLKLTALRAMLHWPGLDLSRVRRFILSEKDFDKKLRRGVKSLVDGITSANRDRLKYFSFACMYCAFHQPELYLSDNECWTLEKYNWLYNFMQGRHISHSTYYSVAMKPLFIFREYYGLQRYSLPDIQHFLAQLSREESDERARYAFDRDSERISRNEVILGMLGQNRSGR